MSKESNSKAHEMVSKEESSGARQKLMQVAVKLIAENGLAGTSTREIAKESGLNISLISYYFGGKEGLYKAILREHMQGVQIEAEKIFDAELKTELTAASFYQQMEMVVDLLLDQRSFDETMMKVMLRERVAGYPFARQLHEEVVGPTAERFVGIIRKAQEKNIVKKEVNPNTFFIVFIEGLWGYISALDCGLSMNKCAHKIKKNGTNEEFKKAYLDILLKGIQK